MATTIPELVGLPAPEVIATLDYEATRASFIARLRQQLAAYGIEYDVDMLETDPGVILMEAIAYVDMGLRQRINEAIQANFLSFARGSDLEHLGQFYGVARMPGEEDERFRTRIVLAIRGRSTGGTEPRYQSVAMGASLRVADARVYRLGRDPRVRVALFARDNGGIADASLIALVEAALNDPAVRMVNDEFLVESAIRDVVNIVADVWLLPNAPLSIITSSEQALRAAWVPTALMGRDITKAWVSSKLLIEGIQNIQITSPESDIVVPFNRSAALGTVTLNFKGREY